MKPSYLASRLGSLLLFISICAAAAEKPKPFRLPAIPDRMPPVIWGSECQAPDGPALSFGGEDLKAADGSHHTHFKEKAGDEWAPLLETLRSKNPFRQIRERVLELRQTTSQTLAQARSRYFDGLFDPVALSAPVIETAVGLEKTLIELAAPREPIPEYQRNQLALALEHLRTVATELRATVQQLKKGVDTVAIKSLHGIQLHLEQTAELLDCEPAPRALSPLVYDEKNKLFILFGGDHLDYLTNDTWVFDPAQKTWAQRHPKGAPPPRANHQLSATDGVIKLTGGYTYSNNTDYMGGPYINLNDGAWSYDVAANAWKSDGDAQAVEDGNKTYRSGAFHPNFFMQGDKPDAETWTKTLREIPANTWVAAKPPYLPQMQRDWGTAVLDPDHDVLLRWSGGHCAHGGSDVVTYHFSTDRWELPFPVELPLGQCYTNTAYPGGVNFNLRPWVTGHTYKSYAYDAVSRRMIFVGHRGEFFRYNPAIGDWDGRAAKPSGMTYEGCFYDLLCKQTPQGIWCWTHEGRMFFYEGKAGGEGAWSEKKIAGEKLPNSNVDSAGINYDAKRERLLIFPGNYGKPYSGQIFSVDLKTMTAAALNPAGMAGAAKMPGFLRETCYVASQDFVLAGVTLPPGDDGTRWTPVYDCAANKWIAFKIDGPNPAGKDGRNVSLGLVYDAKRDLIWAVDTRGSIFVLRVDGKTVARKEL